jgi:hypothetical protein
MSKFLRPHTRFRNDWGPGPYPAIAQQNCPEALIVFRMARHRILKPELIESPVKYTTDFVMLFCQTPHCQNFCCVEESTATRATFTCRECSKASRRRVGVQLHQFDKSLGGHVPGEGAHTPGASSERSITRRNAKAELRKLLGGNDPMLVDGHQVLKDRRVERECPEWMCDRFELVNFLIQAFPKMLEPTSPKYRKQRETAGLWCGVTCLYHRMGLPASYVADLLSYEQRREQLDGTSVLVSERVVTEAQVERIVNAITKRRAGLRADGKPLTGKRGRPKKKATAAQVQKATELLIEVLDSEAVNDEINKC